MLLSVVVAVCVAILAVASADTEPHTDKIYYDLEDAENLFKEHIKTYEKIYTSEEYKKRFEIYKKSLVRINELNSKYPDTIFEANSFADMTPEEEKQHFGFKLPSSNEGIVTPVFPDDLETPKELDYRKQGIVTPVKNQQNCGSCAIFSAIGNVESLYAMKHKQLVSLSEQQVMDCMGFDCIYGTLPHIIFVFLKEDNYSSMRETDYPYKGEVQSTCTEKKGVATVTGYQWLNISDEAVLKKALLHYGPLSVALIADPILHYKKGIFVPPKYVFSPVDHGVLLVGYGEETGTPFWILKNSWGPRWGEQGYLRLLRGKNALKMGTSYSATCSVA